MSSASISRRLLLAALAGSATGAFAQPASKPGGYTELRWDDLVPKGWDPMAGVKDKNLGALNDGDPRAMDMMTKLREAWDNAPAEPKLDGAAIKLPGYLVPLDESKAGITEFLLVPYFGACIHSPPPPANQIVLVQPAKPLQGFQTMDTVWVSGRLRAARQGSPMGTSAYRLEAALVDRYQAPAR
ncbi:DUF3299 domain-containing protein [Aquabacterium humicola]|uniref:DUF3299 domain-containing protein n=1 Tax=Aquabacterium humicola TaxID=3237377 RepID=UPI002543050D|nr:DUF3299 domain-containing protein [Rubrivivax pictus]